MANQAPVAVLVGPLVAVVGEPVEIDPTRSRDPDGQIANYDINFGDGVTKGAPLAVVEHRYAKAGTYTVTLTVRDRAGKTGKTTTQVVVQDAVVQPPPVVPTITKQPVGTTIASGETARIEVVATGTEPLRYQWFDGSVELVLVTTPAFDAKPQQTSTYVCRVSNKAGSVDSEPATVVVEDVAIQVLPMITMQPQSKTITAGQGTGLWVEATGTPPLTYQWFKDDAAIAGATDRTYQTQPLTANTSYSVDVSNAAGHVRSSVAVVTVAAPGTKRVLVAEDFQYLGAMRLPGELTPFSYGALAARKVNGRLHFFMTGENSANAVSNWGVLDPVFEFADTEQYAVDYLQAPRAEVITRWGDVYQGKRVTWNPDGQPGPMQYLLPGGLLWAHDRLYWSYFDGYNVSGRLDPCFGCTVLGASPAEMRAYGPWQPDVGVKNAGGYLLQMPDGSLGAGIGLTSGNVGSSWGPILNVGAAFPTPDTPVGATAPPIVFPAKYVKYGFPGRTILPDGTVLPGIAQDGTVQPGDLLSMPRSGNYVWHDPAPANVTEIDPAKSNGAGSFTQADGIGGCLYIDLPDKHGLLFGVSLATGHVWYGRYSDCGHGLANPCGGGTGPNSSSREPRFIVYDPAQCFEVAAGTRDSKLVPALEFNPESLAPGVMPIGCAKSLIASYFDAETRRLYAVSSQADWSIPGYGLPLMHVFQIR